MWKFEPITVLDGVQCYRKTLRADQLNRDAVFIKSIENINTFNVLIHYCEGMYNIYLYFVFSSKKYNVRTYILRYVKLPDYVYILYASNFFLPTKNILRI